MKRYRHYDKEICIILSCFGSVIEQARYLELQAHVQEHFKEIPVLIAFNSRMVLKKLAEKGEAYKTLPQMLADCDREGFRKMVVLSVNLFPTSEHELIKKTAEGFNSFSPSHIRVTEAVFGKAKATTQIIGEIERQLRDQNQDVLHLYVIHGAPELDLPGLSSVNYVGDLVETLDERNFYCSLEGALPFHAVKEGLMKKMQKAGGESKPKLTIVPILMVSGNHFISDMQEIKEALSESFEAEVAAPLFGGEKFCLIEMPQVQQTMIRQIEEQIVKFG